MRIALVPLDERPVNVDLPREVAAIAGIELLLPPAAAMPSFRETADLGLLHDWLREVTADPGIDQLVVCIDTLVQGGIIPARITGDSIASSLQRLDTLRELTATYPGLVVTAASLIMRASDSYSNVEEPDYWSEYGRELHALGGELHRVVDADVTGKSLEISAIAADIPEAVRSDFELRRLRNHTINLAALALHEEGVIETLALTADDTAPHSAGSVEQLWLRHWARALPRGRSVMMYPGADEVGAVLVARAISLGTASPRWQIVCADPGGLDRVPNFENTPVLDSVTRQIVASGGVVGSADEPVDMVIVVHAPDPAHGDFFRSQQRADPEAISRTVDAVRSALSSGAGVALADVRFSNGGDPGLVDRLVEEGLLLRLWSYGGWNTAGNSIGGAVAQATAQWSGRRLGSFNEGEARRALLVRILDDRAYQSATRLSITADEFGGDIGPVGAMEQHAALARIHRELQAYLDWVVRDTEPWQISNVTLPWARSFEIGLMLELS